MKYEFSYGDPISEEDALAKLREMGLHAFAFDINTETDEPLHWHEFEGAAWIISGSGSFADETGAVTHVKAGCHSRFPAGWLHQELAGTKVRVAIGTNIPFKQWTHPINKEPSSRPAELVS